MKLNTIKCLVNLPVTREISVVLPAGVLSLSTLPPYWKTAMAQSLVVDPDLLMVISWQDEPSESKITEKPINKSSAALSTLERMNPGKKLTVLASVGAADNR